MSDVIARYPLFCGFRELIIGNGWAAGVEAYGRVLAEHEAGGWWFYGVNPGAISAGGSTREEAHARLREQFQLFLFDTAEEAPSFEAFRAEVDRFFRSTNAGSEELWLDAVREVRAGRVTLHELQKQAAESQISLKVDELQQMKASDNKVPEGTKVAA